MTAHKAQGLTIDHAFVVADESIDGEWGYVAMSRGRHTNRLYLARDQELPGHAPAPPTEPLSDLARRLERSRARPPLSDHDVYEEVETALRWQHVGQQLAQAIATSRQRHSLTTELERLTGQRRGLLSTMDQLQERLQHTERGLGRLTQRSQRDDLRQRLAGTQSELDGVRRQIAESERQLALLGEPTDVDTLRDEHARLQTTLDAAAAVRARQLRGHPPAYVIDLLGPRPHDVRSGAWDDAVEVIARYRTRWLVDDPHQALGPPEGNPLQQAERRATEWTIRNAARHLRDIKRGHELSRGLDLGSL